MIISVNDKFCIVNQMSLSFYHHVQSKEMQSSYSRFISTQILMGYLFLFLSLLPLLHAFTPSSSVPLPKSQHQTQHLIESTANTTVPYIVPRPASITSTAAVRILQGQNCQAVRVSPVLLKKSYIQLPINMTEIAGSGWLTEVMSIALDQDSQTVYAFLDNGTLIKSINFNLEASLPTPVDTLSYARDRAGAVDTWFISHHELIWFEGRLFSLSEEKLQRLIIDEEGFWAKEAAMAEGVVLARVYNATMYIVTRNQLRTYRSQVGQNVIKVGKRLVDVLLLGNSLFVLDSESGLVQTVLNGTGGVVRQVVWQVEQLSKAVGLKGVDSSLFVIYDVQHRNYIGEYFIVDEKLYLNRYYHNYYRVKDIHLTKNYAIIDCYNEFVLLHHSINRHSFKHLTPIQFLYRSNGTKVSGIHILSTRKQLSFLVGLKSSIELNTLISHPSSNGLDKNDEINALTVACTRNTSGTQDVVVEFQGPCAESKYNQREFVCKAEQPLTLNFEPSRKRKDEQNKHNRLLIWLSLIAFTIFCLVACMMLRSKLKEIQKKLKQHEEKMQEGKEKTFNAEIA